MDKKPWVSLRDTIRVLREQGELFVISKEVDPIYEIAGIQKALEGGPALLFENIKGYPNMKVAGNIFSNDERSVRVFGMNDIKSLKLKLLDALRHPISPKVISSAPCQEVVEKKDINIMATLPILKHSERDGARVLSGGILFPSSEYLRGGNCVSFKRMHFRGNDWATVLVGRGSHLGDAIDLEHRGESIPMTINIGAPPAVMMVAAGGLNHTVIPEDTDELAIAGAFQGFPVELVKTLTIKGYAIADSEVVIEGYLTPERAWETEEAEKSGKYGVAPFFPEYTGYLGRAFKVKKFQVTAITRRADRPIYYSILAKSLEAENLQSRFGEACYYELAERKAPGLVKDVNILHGQVSLGGVVFQVEKKRRSDEGYERIILSAALSASLGLQMAIAVDEDIDIYSAEDVLWAMTTRVNPAIDIIRTPGGGMGQLLMPGEKAKRGGSETEEFGYEGGIGINATVPYNLKWAYERAKYPVHLIDLRKYFSDEEIQRAQALQSEYARSLSRRGA